MNNANGTNRNDEAPSAISLTDLYASIEAKVPDAQTDVPAVCELASFFRSLSETAVAQKLFYQSPSHAAKIKQRVGGSGKRWHYWSVKDILDPVQQKQSLVVIQSNCTQLVDTQDDLDHFKQREDDKLATFSHELRTPLNGIIGLAESLGQRPEFKTTPTVVKSIQAIISCGRDLARNIEAAMEFSAADRDETDHDNVNLVDIVTNVLEMCKDRTQPDVMLVNNVRGFHGLVYGDPVKLERILLQLIDNACKFTSFGSITVTARERSGGQFIEISVTDTGCGIDESQMRRIFGQFEQADMSATRRFGGLGLGLSLCKKFVEEGGGDIDVVSSVGKGSCFRFTVPTSAEVLATVQSVMKRDQSLQKPKPAVQGLSHIVDVTTPKTTERKSLSDSDSESSGEAHTVETDDDVSESRQRQMDTPTGRRLRDDTEFGGEVAALATRTSSEADDNTGQNVADSAMLKSLKDENEQIRQDLVIAKQKAKQLHDHMEKAQAREDDLQSENEQIRQDLVVAKQEAKKLREHMEKAKGREGDLREQIAQHKANLLHRYTSKSPRGGGDDLPSHRDLFGKYEILSVDDNPINQMVIQNILTPAGYAIATCSDGIECLNMLEERDYLPDLLLLDIMMPQLSGYQVCFKLREMFPTSALPIIMVSAKTRESSIVDGFKAGANDYLTKPYKRQELLARVETQLRLKDVWRQEIEAERTDALLQQLMPSSVLPRFKSGEVVADVHSNLTVLVADVQQAHVVVARTPRATMRHIEKLVDHFRLLCGKHGVLKVDTIGSSLMAVAGHEVDAGVKTKTRDKADGDEGKGAPDVLDKMSSDQHRMFCVADRFLEFVAAQNATIERQNPGQPAPLIEIRMGLHTGPGVSGILPDASLPWYGFFGNSVRTATRMAHSAFPNTVQASEQFVRKCDDSDVEFVVYGEKKAGNDVQKIYLAPIGDYSKAMVFKYEEAKKTVAESKPQILSDEITLQPSPIVEHLGESFKRALLRTHLRSRSDSSLSELEVDETEEILTTLIHDFVNNVNVTKSKDSQQEVHEFQRANKDADLQNGDISEVGHDSRATEQSSNFQSFDFSSSPVSRSPDASPLHQNAEQTSAASMLAEAAEKHNQLEQLLQQERVRREEAEKSLATAQTALAETREKLKSRVSPAFDNACRHPQQLASPATHAAVTSRQHNPIANFLESRGLPHYLPAFQREEITMNVLPLLTDKDLKELGVASMGARMRILGGIETIKDSRRANVR